MVSMPNRDNVARCMFSKADASLGNEQVKPLLAKRSILSRGLQLMRRYQADLRLIL